MCWPSPPSACPSCTHCNKTHSQTSRLTTCNNPGPGWTVQQEAMGAVLLPGSRCCLRAHTSCVVRLNDTQGSRPFHWEHLSLWKGLMSTGAWGKGEGLSLLLGAEQRGTKWVCVFGGKEQGGFSPPSTSRAKGAEVGAVPTQQRRQKAGTSANTVLYQWSSEFCCWRWSSIGRFLLALPTGSCLFLSPQQASLSDMGHSSFLFHALKEREPV